MIGLSKSYLIPAHERAKKRHVIDGINASVPTRSSSLTIARQIIFFPRLSRGSEKKKAITTIIGTPIGGLIQKHLSLVSPITKKAR